MSRRTLDRNNNAPQKNSEIASNFVAVASAVKYSWRSAESNIQNALGALMHFAFWRIQSRVCLHIAQF